MVDAAYFWPHGEYIVGLQLRLFGLAAAMGPVVVTTVWHTMGRLGRNHGARSKPMCLSLAISNPGYDGRLDSSRVYNAAHDIEVRLGKSRIVE